MLISGRITNISLSKTGSPYLTAIDDMGRVYFPISQTSVLGGYDGVFSNSAAKVGSQILFAKIAGYNVYYLLAYLPVVQDVETIRVDGIATAIEADKISGMHNDIDPDILSSRPVTGLNADYKEVHIDDFMVMHTDSFMNISEPNGVTIQGYPKISMQIPQDGIVRVSANGTANNALLNALPFLDQLFNYVNALEQKVISLSNFVQASTPVLVAAAEAAAVAADTAAPGSGQIIRNQSVEMQQASLDAAIPLPITATEAKTNCQNTRNNYIIVP